MSYRTLRELVEAALDDLDPTTSIPVKLRDGDYLGALLSQHARLIEMAPPDARFLDGSVVTEYHNEVIRPALQQWVRANPP